MQQGQRTRSAAGNSALGRWLAISERSVVAGLLIIGIIIRLGWVFGNPEGLSPRTTESQKVAVSLATTGEFANAFRPDSGPTAHVSPLMPHLVASVYRAGGVDTPRSELVLSLIAIGLISLSFLFTYGMARELGVPYWARAGALAIVTLLPLQLQLEARELKVWEAPLVVATVTGALFWALRLDRRPDLKWLSVAALLVPGAIMFIASPPAALAIFAVAGLLALRRLPARHWPGLAIVAVAMTTLVTLPWALRNEEVLGRMIWSRSNGGLELALAYNDTLLLTADRRAGYVARLAEIHPHPIKGEGYAALRAAGGELAYFDRLSAEARDWIVGHPDGTVTLLFRHLRQYLVPPAWFFDTWGPPARATEVRRWILALPMLVGLIGLPFLIASNRRYLYPAFALVLLMGPYIVVQPILRYRYLVWTLVVFLAFAAVSAAFNWWTKRQRA